MHAYNRLVKLGMGLSMELYGKSFQIDWRATFSSELLLGYGLKNPNFV